jgi:hypothetical protein
MLQKEFLGNSKVYIIKLQTLQRELGNIKMIYSETLKDYHEELK